MCSAVLYGKVGLACLMVQAIGAMECVGVLYVSSL